MSEIKKYGFQEHLSPEFPSQIVVDVTEFCNLACGHCPQPEFSKSEAFGGDHLDIELHKKLIDEVSTDGLGICKYLRYTAQGEPLLHPRFIEMIEYTGSNSDIGINITTNGMLLTEKKAAALLNAGTDVFDISIDAFTSETYDLVRTGGDLKTVTENVLRLIALIKEGDYEAKVVVSFVTQELNLNEADDFKDLWEANGVDRVVLRRLHSAGGAKKDFVKPEVERYPCLYPWERLTLAPDGNIHFCPQDWTHGSIICKFEDTTIKEIWRGKVMKLLREAHLKDDFTEHGFCAQCPDWATTRWPFEDRSYSNMMQEFASSDSSDKKTKP